MADSGFVTVEEIARQAAIEFLRERKGRVWVSPHEAGGHQVEGYYQDRSEVPRGAFGPTLTEMQNGLRDFFEKKGVAYADQRASDILRSGGGGGKWFFLWVKPRTARVKLGHLTSFKGDAAIRLVDPNVQIGGFDVPGTGGKNRDAVIEITFSSPIRKNSAGSLTIKPGKVTLAEKPGSG